MRGPIDYIVVGFEGAEFDGSILKTLADAIDKGIIALISLSVVRRDTDDSVVKVSIDDLGDSYAATFVQTYKPELTDLDDEDLNEIADLIQPNCAAGYLVVEQLWAKPLKEAIINANGVLLAEGRIHPEAAEEL